MPSFIHFVDLLSKLIKYFVSWNRCLFKETGNRN
jgi:hypothetical protein